MSDDDGSRNELDRQRSDLADTIAEWLEWPLVLLAGVWLLLLIVELVHGLSPALERLGYIIWSVFILDFLLRLTLAPQKWRYIRRNWLTLIALILPAVRVLRILRIARAARGIRLVRILSSTNRGMRSLSRTMRRRGLPHVLALTLVVLLSGAAGMYAFERDAGGAIDSYGEALWWTAMLLSTIGSGYWPQSPEGKALTLFLSLYALGILGYVAATLASFFVGREAEERRGVGGEAELSALRTEIVALRAELQRRRRSLSPGDVEELG